MKSCWLVIGSISTFNILSYKFWQFLSSKGLYQHWPCLSSDVLVIGNAHVILEGLYITIVRCQSSRALIKIFSHLYLDILYILAITLFKAFRELICKGSEVDDSCSKHGRTLKLKVMAMRARKVMVSGDAHSKHVASCNLHQMEIRGESTSMKTTWRNE